MLQVKLKKAPKLPESRIRELSLFQKKAGIKFKHPEILNNAFVHSSFANENRTMEIADNERLEFLGDSVLSLVISDWLYFNLEGDEGECTRVRSFVVSEDCLSNLAHELELDKYLWMGKGEEISGGRNKKAILADCMEAVFASYYIDRGFEAVREFILRLLLPEIKKVMNNKHHKDFKTMLQEYVQKTWKKVPVYTLVKTTGPDHDQRFFYTVSFNDQVFGPEGGHNKKDAEQNVAHLAWTKLGFE